MKIDIIAPSSAISEVELANIYDFLLSLKMVPRKPDDLIQPDLFFANTDTKRFEHLKNALYNEDSQVVWCVRGGYGCTRLLPKLAELSPPKKQKLFIGCSDITALHIFLQQQWGWTTLHAPNAKQMMLGKVAETDLLAIKNLLQQIPSRSFLFNYPLEPLNTAAKQTNHITSSITGGNLCLVQASLGTFWQINPDNKILFLEDINERGYQIDRMLTQLHQAGILNGLDAILLGDFIGGDEWVEPTLQRFAESCDFPVLRCHGVGHGIDNHPLPLGAPARLALGTVSKISISCKNLFST